MRRLDIQVNAFQQAHSLRQIAFGDKAFRLIELLLAWAWLGRSA
jgi:hypothetical protein